MDAAKLLNEAKIVPVLSINNIDDALPLADCLYKAGFTTLEITLRTDFALEAIALIKKHRQDYTVAAESVRTAKQMKQVHDLGVDFVVSPGHTTSLIEPAHGLNLPFVPGAVTPSGMMSLYDCGYQLRKFFPAQASGGLAFLKAVSAPLPKIKFFPTGGINLALAKDYLAFEKVSCIGGAWFVPADKLAQKDFKAISILANQAAELF